MATKMMEKHNPSPIILIPQGALRTILCVCTVYMDSNYVQDILACNPIKILNYTSKDKLTSSLRKSWHVPFPSPSTMYCDASKLEPFHQLWNAIMFKRLYEVGRYQMMLHCNCDITFCTLVCYLLVMNFEELNYFMQIALHWLRAWISS